jgi:hypothetical protein
MCLNRNRGWASLGLDLGPGDGTTYFDASKHKEFSFWAKTPVEKRARMKITFRDATAKGYLPQASAEITPLIISKDWKKHSVNLDKIRNQVNLKRLVHIGLAFGEDVGNPPGTVIFVDDVAFTGYSGALSDSKHVSMPEKFPQHWPYNNVGATAWFIFVELNINPFEISVTDQNNSSPTLKIQTENDS